MLRLAAVVVATVMGATLAAGSSVRAGPQLEKARLPITVTAVPNAVLPGREVVISGESVALKARGNTVTITIEAPGRPPERRVVDLAPSGAYRLTFSDTTMLGTYKVTAQAPEGGDTATATFAVGALESVADATVDELALAEKALDDLVDELKKYVDALPDSPAEEEAEAALDTVDDDEINLALLAALRDLLRKSARLVKEVPDPVVLNTIGPLLEQATALVDESKALRARLEDRLLTLKNQTAVCDGLEALRQVIGAGSLVADLFADGKLGKLTNVLTDKETADRLMGLLAGGQKPPSQALALNVWFDAWTGFANGRTDLQTKRAFLGGTLVNALTAVGDKAFDYFCDQYAGTFEATFVQRLLYGGKVFWRYDLVLEGEIFIRYQKSNATKSEIDVSGDLRGAVTSFKVKEDVEVIQPGIRRGVLARTTLAPKGLPYVKQAGAIPQRLNPSSFIVPLRGIVKDDKLIVRIAEEGLTDIPSFMKGRVWFLMNSFDAPVIQRFELGFQKAAWILNRGTNGAATFDVKVDAAKKISRVKKTFTRSDSGPTFKVDFAVSIDACNPECPD